MNKGVLEAYLLENVHVIRLFQENKEIPKLDANFSRGSLATVMKLIKNRKVKGELGESLKVYNACRCAHSPQANGGYINQGWCHNAADQMATMTKNALPMNFYRRFHKFLKLDPSMWYLYEALERKVNVYTMDYRGTGRKLEDKYGDLAAFSTTSAANDLVNFISDYTNDAGTTIYGFGYGTMWVERVIHLAPPKVRGYVLDSVMTTSGVKPEKISYETSKDIEATIQHLMTKFDKKPKSTCAKLVKTLNSGQDDDPPSFALRYLLGTLLLDSSIRALLPPVVYRLLRCSPEDVDVLKHLMVTTNQGYQPQGISVILDNLVLFSEKWEVPTPSVSKLKAQFEEYLLNVWAAYVQVPQYCAFSKEKSRVCNKLKLGDYPGNGIIYERDEYWNKPATIPNQASVLLLSSKMDHLAPYQYAKFLLDALDGNNKEMITLQYTAGGNLVNFGTGEELCGLILLSSFVLNNGDLDYLDKSCVPEEKAALNFTLPISFQYTYLSTDDAYDGIYDPSLNASYY
ncbi:Serine protease [Phytophthora megakarya]|uniref:Serine protease n=1 Tax=Phytophthora megakarya TaxID=4795 RepID=A0A225WL84_9STRA|nr:Serine protease [Phytophthora megakarya]